MRGYIPIQGTNGWRDGWAVDDGSHFARMMTAGGFFSVRSRSGVPYAWSTDLNGAKWWGRHSDWEAGANALSYFLDGVSYEDRNLIAHSHGGQCVFICQAAHGPDVPIRTLVTVGTPVRDDVPWRAAAEHVGRWMHIYDNKVDWIAQAGQLFDKRICTDRFFNHPRCQNIGLSGISHSSVLRDEQKVLLWVERGWREAIEEGPTVGV